MTDIVYLACPYSHEDPAIRLQRFDAANKAAAYLISLGNVVFSPISMTHPIDVVMAAPGKTLGSDFWLKFDEAYMAVCARIVVLTIDGWDRSSGVKREVAYFNERGRPVDYITIEGDRAHIRYSHRLTWPERLFEDKLPCPTCTSPNDCLYSRTCIQKGVREAQALKDANERTGYFDPMPCPTCTTPDACLTDAKCAAKK